MHRDFTGQNDIPVAPAIDLARQASFSLGHVDVIPAARRVEAGSWSQRIEPRAMQVLVVLADACPTVVGRAELNARVWSGRVVGDDAVNRAIQTLRRVALDAPAPVPFQIETIARVGYRLIPAELAEPRAVAPIVQSEISQSPAAMVEEGLASERPADVDQERSGHQLARWVIAGLALASLATVGAVLFWHALGTRSHAQEWSIGEASAFNDLPAGASDVSLSPDGRRLAYRGKGPGGRDRIFVRVAGDGGAGTPASPRDFDARRPVWSPNSADLAFSIYDPARPCRMFVMRANRPATLVGSCETARDPHLAWSYDGRMLLFGDASGENAVQRISAVAVDDGRRSVHSSPPGDSMGDGLPMSLGDRIVFQRQFGWADEGWISRDTATGAERLMWRRRGVAGSVAAVLPDGALAIAWTRAGASGLDIVGNDGQAVPQSIALGPVTAISASGKRLLVETDRGENTLIRATAASSTTTKLITMRGRISGPVLLPDGGLRFPVTSAGVARIWQRDSDGSLRYWGTFTAARIAGLALSPDGRLTAALVTGSAGREIVVFDADGRPIHRWNPQARSLNSAAWSGNGRHLIVPVLDGAGWRLFSLDPFTGAPARDLGVVGFALVQNEGSVLYAVRAGETTGARELWRLDGGVHRLPIDLTLFDIVNWRVVGQGLWLPDRSNRGYPQLVLRDVSTGRVLHRVDAWALAGSGSGMAADAKSIVYVAAAREAPEYAFLALSKGSRAN